MMGASRLLRFAGLLLFAYCAAAQAAWTISVDDKTGQAVIAVDGARAVDTTPLFWGKNWQWAGLDTQFRLLKPYEYALSGRSAPLKLDLTAKIARTGERQLRWQYDFDAKTGWSDVIGGCLSFHFLPAYLALLGSPQILPGNRGWVWGGAQGQPRFEMRFDPALAAVYFEPGRKDELRAYFFFKSIPAGKHTFSATLTATGKVAVAPTQSERYGASDSARWLANPIDGKALPVDLSYLNDKPAGRHGFVRAERGKLIFADGKDARFWGTNITAWAVFGADKQTVQYQAHRLAALGFNLVRIHHHDSPWVDPNIFGGKNVHDTRRIQAQMMDKIDWWIKCLKDEGIYVWLDLHVQRAFKPGDGIAGYDELAKGGRPAELKGFNYVNPSIREAMQRFNEAYLTHLNPYTHTRLADEPAVAALLLTNENDVTSHFGNALLPANNVPYHSALYMRAAEAFAEAHDLPAGETWRAWTHGPAKLYLNDLQHRFDAEMIAQLRSLRVRAPLVTTSFWGDNPLSSLPALAAGDMVDVHAYTPAGDLEKNPFVAPNSLARMALGRVSGMPYSVSEWNASSFANPDRHAVALYVAATAARQGWNALLQYAYAQVAFNAGGGGDWQAYNDPALLATLPAAALLYRQGHVAPARTTYVFAPTAAQLFDQEITPENMPALGAAAERGRFEILLPAVKELPWLKSRPLPPGAIVISDPKKLPFAAGAEEIVSDTGEVRRNWRQGILTIDTPLSQIASGWIGGRRLVLKDVAIAASTPFASIAVQSLDGNPIRKARRIMISLAARSVSGKGNQLPFRSEHVEGKLNIKAPAGLKLYRFENTRALREIPVSYENGQYQVALDRSNFSHWLFLK